MYHGSTENFPHKVEVLTVLRKSDYVLVKTECPMEEVVVVVCSRCFFCFFVDCRRCRGVCERTCSEHLMMTYSRAKHAGKPISEGRRRC